MKRLTFVRSGRTLLLSAAVAVSVLSSGAFAQDSSFIPIIVNIDATVKAVPINTVGGAVPVELAVTGDVVDTLRLPYLKTTGVAYFGVQRNANVPAIVANRGGNITVNLQAQSYRNAEISLHSVNGKRVLRGKVSSSNAANVISRGNVATGVYLLSVKGTDGKAVTARLTHGGGGLNINVAFADASGSIFDAHKISKKAADEPMTWIVTVSAEGCFDSVFAIQPIKWTNPQKNIGLYRKPPPLPESVKGTFIDVRNGKVYKTITVVGQTWMAENLNYSTRDSWCYGEGGNIYKNAVQQPPLSSAAIQDNCVKYGYLYTWETAKTACPIGWHLPTSDEWETLIDSAGGYTTFERYYGAGKVLRSTSGWFDYAGNNTGNGTDDFGFSALPGGSGYSSSDGISYRGDIGTYGTWWTTTQSGSDRVYVLAMSSYSSSDYSSRYNVSMGVVNTGQNLIYSVRCLQN